MSESSGEETVAVDLPSDLHDWLEAQAAALGTDKEQLLMQLLLSYQTTLEAEDGLEGQLEARVEERAETALEEQLSADEIDEELLTEITRQVERERDQQIEATVKSILADNLDEQIQSAVRESVGELITEQITEATNSTQRQLGDRIDALDKKFQSRLDDVRERVIQVKKETDKKAPDSHTHEELQTVRKLDSRIDGLEDELQQLRIEIDETLPKHEDGLEELETQLSEIDERLQTVAWVTSDLRDAFESETGLEAVERIKRAAAKADISSAKCDNCGDEVNLALLTDPECPHCRTTVTNVDANPGWFRSPRLETASQLESGESNE